MALLKIKQIENLENQLNAKAGTDHAHVASEIISGVFAAARIPTLAQSKISGLVAGVSDFETRIATLESAGGGGGGGGVTLSVDGSENSPISEIRFDSRGGQLSFHSDSGTLYVRADFGGFE
tara:strand:- start:189 stop:554 length:366 start_codon:yes stop_codon:yes gene_type:complete